MSEQYHSELRSREAEKHVFIIFINISKFPIKIYWIGYRSELVLYGRLASGARKAMNTFETHPWIFKDFTGDLMRVQNREVFWPQPMPITPETITSNERIVVMIHAPLRTLKSCALLQLVPLIKTGTDIQYLPIPSTLKHELENLYEKYIQI